MEFRLKDGLGVPLISLNFFYRKSQLSVNQHIQQPFPCYLRLCLAAFFLKRIHAMDEFERRKLQHGKPTCKSLDRNRSLFFKRIRQQMQITPQIRQQQRRIETSDRQQTKPTSKLTVCILNENDKYFVETRKLHGDYDNASAYEMRADRIANVAAARIQLWIWHDMATMVGGIE